MIKKRSPRVYLLDERADGAGVKSLEAQAVEKIALMWVVGAEF